MNKESFKIDDSVFEIDPYTNLHGGEMHLEFYNVSTGYAFHDFTVRYSMVLPGGWNLTSRIYRMILEELAKEDISPNGVGVRQVK